MVSISLYNLYITMFSMFIIIIIAFPKMVSHHYAHFNSYKSTAQVGLPMQGV